jgi:hypothetical protein
MGAANLKRNLVIHIGIPKTGSTALQSFFARNRSPLVEKSIDYLPIGNFAEAKAGQISSGNGALVARSMLPEKSEAYLPWSRERVGRAFMSAVARSNSATLLLSSELFALAELSAWSNLLAFCKQSDLAVTFVAVLRNQCDWVSSSYLQKIKRHRLIQDPDEAIRRVYLEAKYLRYHSYFSELAKIADGGIHFIPYDKVSSKGLIPAMLDRIGITDLSPYVQDLAPINITPSPEEIAFLRLCNQFNPDMTFSDVLATPLEQTIESKPTQRWTAISPALRDEIQAHFVEENKKLISAFNLASDFFGAPCTNYVDTKSISISTPTLAFLLARYLTTYDRRIRSLSHEIATLKKSQNKSQTEAG